MAFANKKLYAILMQSEEGKDILEGISDKSQEEFEKEVDEFFGKGGKGEKQASEYQEAKKPEKEDLQEQPHLNFPSHKPTKEELDNEVKKMFSSKEEALDYANKEMGGDKDAIERINSAFGEDSKENDYVSQFTELSKQYMSAKTKKEREEINDKMNALKRQQFPEDYENEKSVGEDTQDMYMEEFYKEANGDKNKFVNHFLNRFGVPKGSTKEKEVAFYSKKFDEMKNKGK